MEREALRFENVSKTFGDVRVLHEVSLTLTQGSVCCLIGHNGSGKSTLIKILAGFYEADPGSIVEDRGELLRLTAEPSIGWRSRLRFIHQDLGLVETLGVLDNLALGRGFATGRFGRILWAAERRRAAGYFDRFGIEIDFDIPINRLSAVERTAVAVVRALLDIDEQRGVLVLDEPSASLSAPEAAQLYTIVRELVASGVAVLLVTHRLREVQALADHVIVLRDGRVVADRSSDGLTQDELVEYITGEPVAHAGTRGKAVDSDAPVALRIRSLSSRSLRDFNLTLRCGEVVGVAGLNGSGRDEIANLVFGVTPPVSGHIETDGHNLAGHRPRQAIRAGIAMVPADRAFGIIRGHTVRENTSLTKLSSLTRLCRISSKREQREVRHWLNAVDLAGSFDEHGVEQLSGGSQQKVVLAKWMRLRPRVLVLDEPTQGVDVAAKRSIHKLLAAAAAEGAAVLVCSSDNEELSEIASRALVLHEGTVVAELHGDALTETALTESMLRVKGSHVHH